MSSTPNCTNFLYLHHLQKIDLKFERKKKIQRKKERSANVSI